MKCEPKQQQQKKEFLHRSQSARCKTKTEKEIIYVP